MKQYTIDENSGNQRLDRYLSKLMPQADRNFLQKMLRKKRIKLNGGRAEPKDTVHSGDTVQVYFSDETIEGFQEKKSQRHFDLTPEIKKIFEPPVYEDDHLLVINKPAGLLSQADASGDISLIDAARTYQKKNAADNTEAFEVVISNRLDRNTSGIILMPKDYPTLQAVNAAIRERQALKEYHTIVSGVLDTPGTLTGFLAKDTGENKSTIVNQAEKGAKEVRMDYRPLADNGKFTLLEVTLHTGRSHQIRSQLANFGFPVIGDHKYGDAAVNRQFIQKYKLKHHLLHSRHYAIKTLDYDFTAPYPALFKQLLRDLKLDREAL
ncbi:RluA family pseudouridine synthase [Eubacterium sp. 1001713B170207_170306_E7]|uniref:RluA family pseudouridine synthase n=1 Tax=Eubacterium sp. 1001713B170207_170306_E7 TaxID=2787097 RepID=UPI00189B6005|nr:RluA family pseudouridine synthase [Eubacterium sp. 1001713B170207_170306_E7]